MTDQIKLKVSKERILSPAEFFSLLLHSITQVHVFHLQTKSYAEHVALQGYFDGVGDFIDSLIESYQGSHGIVTGYRGVELKEYGSIDLISYMKNLLRLVEENSNIFKESDLLNTIDEIKSLIRSTIYKLQNLK